MAQERIEIRFKPTGDRALILAIKQLDVVTKRLSGTVSIYEKELKGLRIAQKRYTSAGIAGVKNMRIQAGAFATLRSKLLLFSFAVGLGTAAMKKLFDNMIKQEKVEKKLEQALGRTSSALLNQASALQKVTTFGDEAIIGAQALIASFVDDEEQIKAATEATLDLAAAKGMDLNAAADLVSKTLGSSTNALSRYGITVEGTVGSSKRLESLTRNVAKVFGGQAQASANTFGGRLEQLANISGDVSEEIGKTLAPTISLMAQDLKTSALAAFDFFKELNEFDSETIVRKFETLGFANENIITLKVLAMQERLNFDLGLQEKSINKVVDSNSLLRSILDDLVAHEYRNSIKDGATLVDDYTLSTDNFKDALSILKGEQDKIAKSLRNSKDLTDKSVRADVDKYMAIMQLIVLLEGYLKTIDDVNSSIGLMMEGTEVVAFSFKNFVKILEDIPDVAIEATKQLADIIGELARRSKEEARETISEINEIADAQINALRENANAQMQTEKQTRAFQRMSAKQQAAYEKAIMDKLAADEAEINAKRAKDEEAAKQKTNELLKKQFRVEQALNIGQAIMNTSEAITKALPNVFLAGLVGVMGAAQIALIASQKPPKMQYGGLIGGQRHSQGGTMIEAERGEFVMSRNAVSSIGLETLNRMNQAGVGGAINISFTGNVMSDDFIESEAVPKIKEALRRGGDIGIG